MQLPPAPGANGRPKHSTMAFQETTSNALNEQPTNYNTLLHDEIQLTAVSATQTELNAAISTITPAGFRNKEELKEWHHSRSDGSLTEGIGAMGNRKDFL